jgi:hypothetical protein
MSLPSVSSLPTDFFLIRTFMRNNTNNLARSPHQSTMNAVCFSIAMKSIREILACTARSIVLPSTESTDDPYQFSRKGSLGLFPLVESPPSRFSSPELRVKTTISLILGIGVVVLEGLTALHNLKGLSIETRQAEKEQEGHHREERLFERRCDWKKSGNERQ